MRLPVVDPSKTLKSRHAECNAHVALLIQFAVTVAVVYVPLSAPVQQWSVVHAIWWLRISLFVASIANPPISITEALTSWQVSLTILLDSELRGINKRRNEGWENARKGMPSLRARVAAAVQLRSLASCTLSLALKPGIFVIDVGRTPSLLDFLVVLSTCLVMISYSAGWWCRLWARRLLVDQLTPTLIIPASGFLWKVEHSLHSAYSLYNVGCFTGINNSNPSHHADVLFNITFIVKYLVTWLITLLAPSLLSKSGACVLACKDESTTFCRLTSLTQFNCFSRPVSEMAGRFCCLFEIAGRFHCFFCLLYWSSPSLLLRFL